MTKVLVLGIDAFDPRIYEKLKNKLPNFNQLNFNRLTTTTPPETPVAWSAMSTGNTPGSYGIFDFITRDMQTYQPKLNLTKEKQGIIKTEYQCAMQGDPFWRILTKNNIPATVIRWPVTFPPEEINGKMLSGLGVVDIKGMMNSYRFYTNDDVSNQEGFEKVVTIDVKDNFIETELAGPLTKKRGQVAEIKIPMKIQIKEDHAILSINNKDHVLKPNNWSEFINVRFKIGLLATIDGIFNACISSLDPFRMYVSSIQIDPASQAVPITYPKEYGKELVNEIGNFHTLGMPEETGAVKDRKLSREMFLKQIHQIEAEREKMFFHEFERFNAGVLAFVFDAGDRLNHIFWNNCLKENFVVPKEIEDYYVNKDKFLATILDKLEDTKLLIVSDHGFSNFEKQVNINNWLIENGFMEMGGNKEDPFFKFVDWSKTKAYSMGFTSIFLNLEDREGQGVIREDQKEAVIDQIIERLQSFKDGENNVLKGVYKGSDLYQGEHNDEAPDIVVGFNFGYRMSWKSAIGSLDDKIISENDSEWCGDHLIDPSLVPGVLFTNFDVREDPRIIDIAPTILDFFKISSAAKGKTLILD